MAQMNLAVMLSKLGWGSGFRLPIANDENRELETLLEKEQKRVLDLRIQIAEEEKVTENLQQHLGRVTTELGISKKLLESKRSTLEAESNILVLDRRNDENILREINSINKTTQELKARNQSMAIEIEARRARIDDERYKILGVDTASEIFKNALKQKEQNVDFILKLLKVDQKLVDDFEKKFQTYGEELAHIKIELDNTVKYTQTLESQYERSCLQYRREHKERLEAIDLWKRTLESLNKRDLEIQYLAQEYVHMETLCKRTDDLIERREEILKVRKANTAAIQEELFQLNKDLSEERLELQEMIEFNVTVNEEVMQQKSMIKRINQEITILNKELQEVDDELATIDERSNKVQETITQLKEQHEAILSGVQSIEESNKQAEAMILEEEKKEEHFTKELDKMTKYHFQKSNEARILRKKSEDLVFEINTAKALHKKLSEQLKLGYIDLQKMKHQGYEMELKVMDAQTRYQYLSNPKKRQEQQNENTIYYNPETLERCREELQQIIKDKIMVMHQKNHLQDVATRLEKQIEASVVEKAELDKERAELDLGITQYKKQLGLLEKQVKHYEVENILLNLEYRKSILIEKEQKHSILNLEQQRLYLQMAANERRAEIEEHKALLRQQLHLDREERSKLASQRNDVLQEVERCKKKYDIFMASLASTDEREKEDFSEAFFIIKNAQERESIKREGDLWDRRVQEAENEVVALQNTVALMMGSNRAFKDSVAPLTSSTEEGGKLQELEHSKREAVVRKRKAEKLQRELAKHCSEKESEIYNLTQTIEMLASLAEDKKYELNAVMVEIASQKTKIDRANKVAAKMARDIGTQNDDEKKLIEAELQLKCAREKFGFALKSLDRALSIQPTMRTTVADYLKQNPLLIEVGRRLSSHGKCEDSVGTSGTATPHSGHKSSEQMKRDDKFVGTIYERNAKFSSSRSRTVSVSGMYTPDGSIHGSMIGEPINTSQLKAQLQKLQAEHHSKLSEIQFHGGD